MRTNVIKQRIIILACLAMVLTTSVLMEVKTTDSSNHHQQEVASVQTSTEYDNQQPVENVKNYVESVETVSHNVNNPVNNVNNSVSADSTFAEEQEILAIIIYQEAGGDECSDDTRRKVGSVFLNRVNSPLFPDTFEEVATAEKQYGTLYLTGLKWPDRAFNEQEADAVNRAYELAEELLIGGSILPDNVIWQAEFTQGDGIYCYQDGIYFCYTEVSE